MPFTFPISKVTTVVVRLPGIRVKIQAGFGHEIEVDSKPTVYLNHSGTRDVYWLEIVRRPIVVDNVTVKQLDGSVTPAVVSGTTTQDDIVDGVVITMPSRIGSLELVTGDFSGVDEARRAGVRFS